MSPMIDHVTLNVRDIELSKAFYSAALAPLGYTLWREWVDGAGFTVGNQIDFFLAQRGEPSAPVHVAFSCSSRKIVNAFHEAGIAAGGTDNGPPGLRPVYHDLHYAAYVLDPDGNNIEAVTFERE